MTLPIERFMELYWRTSTGLKGLRSKVLEPVQEQRPLGMSELKSLVLTKIKRTERKIVLKSKNKKAGESRLFCLNSTYFFNNSSGILEELSFEYSSIFSSFIL